VPTHERARRREQLARDEKAPGGFSGDVQRRRLSRRDICDHCKRAADHDDARETREDGGDREQRDRDAHRAEDQLLLVVALPLQLLRPLRGAVGDASLESFDERVDHGRFHLGAELGTGLDHRPQLVASDDLGHAGIVRVTGRLRKRN